MKSKIEIKNWMTGSILFELETENNSIRKTLLEALKHGANLSGADLREADLRGADLSGANLYGADLREADLSEADLYGVNLYGANLSEADLRGADLSGADLYGANLSEAENTELARALTLITPEGSIIGWKKCKDNMLVKLLIPENAKRHNATGRKCRAEFAEVLEIIDLNDKTKKPTEAFSQHDDTFKYTVGETVRPEKWCEDSWNECAGGIHFFITRLEAEQH